MYLFPGDAMSYFYATPYAVVLGNNLKTYTRVTPNRCARMCLEEDTFVCKSFDYQVRASFLLRWLGLPLASVQFKSDGALQRPSWIKHWEVG